MSIDRYRRWAKRYNSHAKTQSVVAKQLVADIQEQLSETDSAGTVLELGCGTGILTELLLKATNWDGYFAIDRSQSMVAVATENSSAKAIQFQHADIDDFCPPKNIDWIASNQTLHWLADPFKTMARLSSEIGPQGRWGISVTVAGTYPELSEALAFVIPEIKLPADSFRSSSDWQDGLAGIFNQVDARLWTIHEPFSDIHSLLRAAQASTGSKRPTCHFTRSQLRQLESIIREKYGQLVLTSKVMMAQCRH